jgi:hypothetical protein
MSGCFFPGDPDQPETGSLIEQVDMATNDVVAEKIAAFERIYVHYPRHTDFHRRCDYLARLGVKSKGSPQKGFRVLAPSGSGKSKAGETYVALVERDRPRTATFVPVAYIALEKGTTPRLLMVSILDFFKDPNSDVGSEVSLRRRAYACFERFECELLIIDEVQHLNYRSSAVNDVTDHLKRFLDSGAIPIVFMGTEEAHDLFTRNLQLNGRLLPPCDFAPLDLTSSVDRNLLHGYVAALDRAIVDASIMQEPAGLANDWILGCLHQVSLGVIGRISRLLQAALEIALRRGATRLEVYDLALAVDRWAIPQGFCTTKGVTIGNPFREAR